MTPEQKALQVLVEAALKAQKHGVFTLEEAALVLESINTFKSKAPNNNQEQHETESNDTRSDNRSEEA